MSSKILDGAGLLGRAAQCSLPRNSNLEQSTPLPPTHRLFTYLYARDITALDYAEELIHAYAFRALGNTEPTLLQVGDRILPARLP